MNISELYKILFEAGRLAVSIRSSGLQVDRKMDGSPVTAADLAIDSFLSGEIPKLTKEFSCYWSEERTLPNKLNPRDHHWIVDPIDGTKEFIKGSTDWVIQGALLQGNQLKMGFVFQPATGTLWLAESQSTVIQRWTSPKTSNELASQFKKTGRDITLVRSSSNPDPAVEELMIRHPGLKFFRRGSVGLKAITLCEGEADVYINFSRQCGPWDLLPCIPLLEAAGLVLHWLDVPPADWTEPKVQSRFVMGASDVIQELFPTKKL